VDPVVRAEVDEVFAEPVFPLPGGLAVLAGSEDRRIAWPLVDLLRFHQGGDLGPDVAAALEILTGEAMGEDWVGYTDMLLREDVPAPPGYLPWKRAIFLAVDEGWAPFFEADADLDWREVTWGGVFRDGVPSLDDPVTVPAQESGWPPDDDVVFGLVVAGQARAYPRRVLEVHEVVNDELGGLRISLSYCTLCGAPIAYQAEAAGLGAPLRLRTSGLLQPVEQAHVRRGLGVDVRPVLGQGGRRAAAGCRGRSASPVSSCVSRPARWSPACGEAVPTLRPMRPSGSPGASSTPAPACGTGARDELMCGWPKPIRHRGDGVPCSARRTDSSAGAATRSRLSSEKPS
jgi:hypothetical protein